MSLSALLHEVERQATEQLQQAATLPTEVRFRFDATREASWDPGPHVPPTPHSGVQKKLENPQ